MSERENFLERWSRKKAEAQDEPAPAAAKPDADPPNSTSVDAESKHVASGQPVEASPKPAAPKPEFDLASLPSLESITATTDIRAFLSPGVPQELTRAALRRAWLADPAIRDFVGLQENDWDFTNPNAIPGFGDLPPGTDIKKMVAQIFGETGKPAEEVATHANAGPAPAATQGTAATEETPPAEATPVADAPVEPGDALSAEGASAALQIPEEPPSAEIVQRNNNTAPQQRPAEVSGKDSRRRQQHGGALPKG